MASKVAGACEGLGPLIFLSTRLADMTFVSSHRDGMVSYYGLNLRPPDPESPQPRSSLQMAVFPLLETLARAAPTLSSAGSRGLFSHVEMVVFCVADSSRPGACLL